MLLEKMLQKLILIRGENVELKNVSKVYEKNEVLTEVNLSLGAGITGLIGKNGAGKTTLMKILCEVIPNYSGQFHREANDKVGYLIEAPKYYKTKSGMFNIQYFSQVFNKDIDKEYIQSLIQDLEMETYIHKKVKTYSMGMKQRLGLVIALLQKPAYLILDEPTNGMDPDGSIDVLNIIKSLVDKYNISVLISSHKLEEIESISDEIVFIHEGRLGKKTAISQLNTGVSYTFMFNDKDIEQALSILELMEVQVTREDNQLTMNRLDSLQEIFKALHSEDIYPIDINKTRHSVKDYYFEQMAKGREK